VQGELVAREEQMQALLLVRHAEQTKQEALNARSETVGVQQ